MIHEIHEGAEKYQKSHRRKSIWHRIVSVLSAITVFITTYAMILPAITMEPSPGIKLEQEFYYEDPRVRMIFHVEGRAVLTDGEDAPQNLSAKHVALEVVPLADNSSVKTKYLEYAQEFIPQDDLLELLTLQLNFTHKGRPLDMRGCRITARIIAKSQDPAVGEESLTPLSALQTLHSASHPMVNAAEGEVLALTAFQGVDNDLSQLDTSFLSREGGVLAVDTTVTGNTMAVAMYATVNPSFTVQYYAYFEHLASSGDKSVHEIDTSGSNLPVNGGPNNMKEIWLEDIGGGKYVLATETVLDVLEKQVDDYAYVNAPGLIYVDRLRQNGNYELDEVWVLKSGRDQTSTNRADWDIYQGDVHFTNRQESAGPNRIYISEGTVIRLVYNSTQGSYTNSADFYDYDISDGYTTSDGIITAVTANNGINSFTAAGSTVKYAFGNSNTQTNFGNLVWRNNGLDNKLNAYNSVNSAYDGCTFGLVTGIEEDGTLIFAEGISAPDLFGRTSGRGKTYLDDYSLQFSRSGDTYTLVAVNGTNAKNLDQLNNPSFTYNGTTTYYDHVFTNNFWPMDSAYTWGAAGHDPVFGSAHKAYNKLVRATNGSGYGSFPRSDDGLDHNSYFGMQYKVTFTLTEEYRGPLDYVFYGDDDMWVFLDGQLVCDIGGVHSSVGQYVNLWDYINKMPENQRYGEHTLYFCYTERGASGSSCYMRFTLPSVTIAAPQVESTSLEISKEVLNISTDQEFNFELTLTDSEGNALLDDYSYTRYDAEGNAMESGIINNSTIIKLRHNERILINFLPEGTKFTIREIPSEGFHSSHTVDGSSTVDSNIAEGSMQESVSIHFINSSSVSLPSTGGSGILLYALPMAVAFAAVLTLPLAAKIVKRKNKNN